MDLFLDILNIFNCIFIVIVTVGFLPQFFYIVFSFLKPKQYKKSSIDHSFGVIICAHNEEDCIAETIKSIKSQNYPQEKIKIFVVCDNCTDNTAEIAKSQGAEVIIKNNPNEARKGYALKYGIDILMKKEDGIESYLIFDADSMLHPDFITKMNDAFDSGSQIARGYCNAKNYDQNIYSGITSLYSIRDNRFNCRVRSAFNIPQLLIGTGMMISRKVFEETGGWDCTSLSEDAEFTLKRINEKRMIDYVDDAIYYDEMQSSLKETFLRHKRMGYGLMRVFFKQALPMGFKFLYTFKYTYLDMFLTLLFIPAACVACLWFPAYYIFLFSYYLAEGYMILVYETGMLMLYIIVFAFLIPFMLQGLLALLLERKRIPVKKFSRLLPSVFCFPFFMIIYAISITCGALSFKCKWGDTKHNSTVTSENISQMLHSEAEEQNAQIDEQNIHADKQHAQTDEHNAKTDGHNAQTDSKNFESDKKKKKIKTDKSYIVPDSSQDKEQDSPSD